MNLKNPEITKLCNSILSDVRDFEHFNTLSVDGINIIRDEDGKANEIRVTVSGTSDRNV